MIYVLLLKLLCAQKGLNARKKRRCIHQDSKQDLANQTCTLNETKCILISALKYGMVQKSKFVGPNKISADPLKFKS